MAFLSFTLERLAILKKNPNQSTEQKKNNNTHLKTCPKPHKQIKKTVNIRFQPTQAFFNFVNMKAPTVPLVT